RTASMLLSQADLHADDYGETLHGVRGQSRMASGIVPEGFVTRLVKTAGIVARAPGSEPLRPEDARLRAERGGRAAPASHCAAT
ncbi:MAG TPA: hypothetical protein VKT77_23145, partial [Chthonomonadaceae bacterium]|nr:hypothetical protein [Chthonomonadaceae bacterium]